MACLCFPGGFWMAALTVMLMVLSPPLVWTKDVPAHYLEYLKSECHFSNGTQRVRLVARWISNQEENVRFDSDVGNFIAVTELGWPSAKHLNGQKDVLEQMRANVDRCKHNYGVVESFAVQRRVEPTVTVYPSKNPSLQHHSLLVCSVNGFYPGHIEVRWLRNGQEETAGVVSTGLIQNGDWTFQTLVMLETVPQSGEVYTCHVEHPSLTSPITVEWSEKKFIYSSSLKAVTTFSQSSQSQSILEKLDMGQKSLKLPSFLRAQSESARSKMLSGVGGFVLGLLFFGMGLFIHFRNHKGCNSSKAGSSFRLSATCKASDPIISEVGCRRLLHVLQRSMTAFWKIDMPECNCSGKCTGHIASRYLIFVDPAQRPLDSTHGHKDSNCFLVELNAPLYKGDGGTKMFEVKF
ncbi:DLA class II histocompatibility antigen, DR-1 beta chain-like [Talpa occidentalis]|uniref:DLA class II histocompatibility antigen, DR-1 beta chain-like n=1 Tax=Talpa occidentalis TaxID=50954 RepID=UPI0023F9A60A|nr:DLA class II histocompatibility antigen, DR-1 beta chain-like [Talpa occidentalis]